MKVTEEGSDVWADEWADSSHDSGDLVLLKKVNPIHRNRQVMLWATVLIVLAVPVVNWQVPSIAPTVLAIAMGFTIATNLSITIMSMSIEDKAAGVEVRMDSLMEELERATNGLDTFHAELDNINLPRLRDNIENARDELGPSLSQFREVSWSDVADGVQVVMDFMQRVDRDKLEKIVQPFIVDDEEEFVRSVPIVTEGLDDGEFVRPIIYRDEFVRRVQ